MSVGLWGGGRFEDRELVPYIIAQVLGGLAGGVLAGIVWRWLGQSENDPLDG